VWVADNWQRIETAPVPSGWSGRRVVKGAGPFLVRVYSRGQTFNWPIRHGALSLWLRSPLTTPQPWPSLLRAPRRAPRKRKPVPQRSNNAAETRDAVKACKLLEPFVTLKFEPSGFAPTGRRKSRGVQ
jgi:hypothetical protein